MSELSKIIETLQELDRMHQLNLELLEQYDVVLTWIIETDLPIPNKEKLASLLHRTKALLIEIQADEPKLLQYQKLADEKKQHFRTDEEEPVPSSWFCYFFVGFVTVLLFVGWLDTAKFLDSWSIFLSRELQLLIVANVVSPHQES